MKTTAKKAAKARKRPDSKSTAKAAVARAARCPPPDEPETKELVKPYEPTPYERRTREAIRTRNKEKPLAPRIKVTNEKGVTKLVPDHAEPSIAHFQILDALGSRDSDFMGGLIKQLYNVGSHGKTMDEDGLNFMLSMVTGIEPRDQVETMLAAQMAATHNATMTFAHRLNHVDNLAQQDSAERAYNKLARTFAAQVEALKRYRSAGEQTVRVEHVTVNEGGQAIVGNVTHGGRGIPQKTDATS